MCLPQAEYCCQSKTEKKKKKRKREDRKPHIFLIIFSHVIGKGLLVSVNLEKRWFSLQSEAGQISRTSLGGRTWPWLCVLDEQRGRGCLLSYSLHTKWTSPKVTLSHSRLLWAPGLPSWAISVPGSAQPGMTPSRSCTGDNFSSNSRSVLDSLTAPAALP